MQPRSGPGQSNLPYQILAGVEPIPGGWLVAPGNLQGINLAPQRAFVLPTLAEVLDYRPSFAIVALHAPIGLPDPGQERECDRMARERLGPRAGSALPAPTRDVVAAATFEEAQRIDPTIDIIRWRSMAKIREAATEVGSWRQRTVWEVNPELTFAEMNGGQPIDFSRRSELGRQTRQQLLIAKLPGADRVLVDRPRGVREQKLLDALADLWTARRVLARSVVRMVEDPTWNEDGVRMDIVS